VNVVLSIDIAGSRLSKYYSKLGSYLVYDYNQFTAGKCFLWASFLSKPQKTYTVVNVATVTGSVKSPPGGDTAPTIEQDPVLSGEPRHYTLPALS